MVTTAYILSLAVLLFAAYVVVMNWGCAIVSIRNKRRGIDRHHSMAPAVSFCLTVVAVVFYPHPHKAWMLIVPLLDIGNWNLLCLPVALPVMMVREWRRTRAANGDGRKP